ncbi:MAG: hypothetical protein J7L72_08950 [Candidatus Aminicenantes bacterium]|nr:hypothetical protein [Candidatus Aminicenantes bacterium]
MIIKKKNLTVFASLFVFFILTLGIHFCHTEKTPQESKDCPACHFQNSIFMTAKINFYHQPELALIEILTSCQIISYHNLIYIKPSTRSPPNTSLV